MIFTVVYPLFLCMSLKTIIPKRAANCVVAFGVIGNHSLSRVIT